METIQTSKDWLSDEAKEQAQNQVGDKKPTPKFDEGKISTVVINAVEPFRKWTDPTTKKTKALIPCAQAGVECLWWLNIQNPFYHTVIEECRAAADRTKVTLKVFRTGQQSNTRYTLVKE